MNTQTETIEHESDRTKRSLEATGKAALESIQEMLAALNCNYDRLDELKEKASDFAMDPLDLEPLTEDESKELKELEAEAGECTSRDDAQQRIDEDPLSIQVRSGWVSLGEDMTADEFEILPATGGPAVRIIGELDNGEPTKAYLEVQDWFTPWTRVPNSSEDALAYACCFYFGEG